MADDGAATSETTAVDEDDDTYVHQPQSSQSRSARPHQVTPADAEFGWHGWLLVGIIVVSFLVVPISILYLPQAQSLVASFGLTLRDAYLVLPLLPAFLLGAVAVWAAVRSRSR